MDYYIIINLAWHSFRVGPIKASELDTIVKQVATLTTVSAPHPEEIVNASYQKVTYTITTNGELSFANDTLYAFEGKDKFSDELVAEIKAAVNTDIEGKPRFFKTKEAYAKAVQAFLAKNSHLTPSSDETI